MLGPLVSSIQLLASLYPRMENNEPTRLGSFCCRDADLARNSWNGRRGKSFFS